MSRTHTVVVLGLHMAKGNCATWICVTVVWQRQSLHASRSKNYYFRHFNLCQTQRARTSRLHKYMRTHCWLAHSTMRLTSSSRFYVWTTTSAGSVLCEREREWTFFVRARHIPNVSLCRARDFSSAWHCVSEGVLQIYAIFTLWAVLLRSIMVTECLRGFLLRFNFIE